MHSKLEEFKNCLDECFSLLSPTLRPKITIQDNYEPYGSGLPIPALIIGDRWAAFMQMWETAEPIASVRVDTLDKKDRGKAIDSPNPYSICGVLVPMIVGDYIWDLRVNYNKKHKC